MKDIGTILPTSSPCHITTWCYNPDNHHMDLHCKWSNWKMIWQLGFNFQQRRCGTFLFTVMSITALEPSQLVLLGALSPESEADHSVTSCAQVQEFMALYFHVLYTLMPRYRGNFTQNRIFLPGNWMVQMVPTVS